MRPSSRLHAEWLRLYAADPAATPAASPDAPTDASPALVDAQGRTRTLVLALGRPADWATLSTVWQAVQAEGGLPAPGIAVSGTDSFQLWFSLAEAVPMAEAHAFLDALRRRCLGHIGTARVSLRPSPAGAHHTATIPAQQGDAEQWSAFVAPDLAPMFNEAPWLDLPPSPEGQAELLSRLRSIRPAEWQAAQAWLRDADGAASTTLDPHTFLREVMNDASVPLALRIEAAKALLPHVPPCP